MAITSTYGLQATDYSTLREVHQPLFIDSFMSPRISQSLTSESSAPSLLHQSLTTDNSTVPPRPPMTAMDTLFVCVVSVTSFLSIPSCVVIIAMHVMWSELRTVGRSMLVQLSVADLLTAIGNLMGVMWFLFRWVFLTFLTALTNSWGLCGSSSSEYGRLAHCTRKPQGVYVVATQGSMADLLTALGNLMRVMWFLFRWLWLRSQELCESRGGRPGLPVPNSPKTKLTKKTHTSKLASADIKQHWSGGPAYRPRKPHGGYLASLQVRVAKSLVAVWKSRWPSWAPRP